MTEVARVLIPRTVAGNDPNDIKDDDHAVDTLKGEVQLQFDAEKRRRGLMLTEADIRKRIYYVNLCREYRIRTGRELNGSDKAVLDRYEADLRREGKCNNSHLT